jgi:hypothetical protein
MTAVNIQRYGELELSLRLGEIDQIFAIPRFAYYHSDIALSVDES